jgi:cytochrome c5
MKSCPLALTIVIFLSLGFFPFRAIGQEADDSKTLFEKKCGACHKIERATSAKKADEEWMKTVTRMKGKRNANISDDEAKAITDYLTKTYRK